MAARKGYTITASRPITIGGREGYKGDEFHPAIPQKHEAKTLDEARSIAVTLFARAVEWDWNHGIPSIDGREVDERINKGMKLRRGGEIDAWMLHLKVVIA